MAQDAPLSDCDYERIMEDAFKPDEETIPSIAEEYKRAKALRECAEHHRHMMNFSMEAAIRAAWCELHPGIVGGRVSELGTAKFITDFQAALRGAEALISSVVERHIPWLQMTADPIDGVSSRNSALELSDYIMRDRTEQLEHESTDVREKYPFAMSWSHRATMEPKESLRKWALASLFMAHEAVDPQHYVEKDVSLIGDRFEEHLFFGRPIRVMVSFVKRETPDPETEEVVHPDFPVRFGDCSYDTLPEGTKCVTEPFDCRTVRDGALVYLISTKLRPKPLDAVVLKGGRGRAVKDRRGCRHTVVGVWDGVQIRSPDGADMERYREIVRERFWRGELREVPDVSPPNPDSHPRVREDMTKIMGRLVRENYKERGQWVAPSVELQLQPLSLFLFTRHGSNGSTHDKYRARNAAGIVTDLFGEQLAVAGVTVPSKRSC